MTLLFRPNALRLGEESFASAKGRGIIFDFTSSPRQRSTPRGMSVRLGKPKAQNCLVFASPWQT